MFNQFIPQLKKTVRQIQLVFEKPYQFLDDQVATQPFEHAHLTPNVYQAWVNRQFAKTLYKHIIRFRILNPDFNFYLFDAQKIDTYMEEFWGDHPIF